MSRSVRLYGKKRGNRQIGAGPLGRLLLVLFFGFFFVAGIGFTVLLVQRSRAAAVAGQSPVSSRRRASCCEKRIGENQSQGLADVSRRKCSSSTRPTARRTRPGPIRMSPGSIPAAARRSRPCWIATRSGRRIKCWYDPQEPTTVCLARGYDWLAWTMLLLPLTFMAVGGGGLIYQFLNWSTSVERRLAMVQRVAAPGAVRGGRRACPRPAGRAAGGQPHEQSRHHAGLPPADCRSRPAGRLAVIMAACLFWNGMVALFVTIAVNSHLRGEPEWFLTPVHDPLRAGGPGPGLVHRPANPDHHRRGADAVEISAHPLEPAGEYEIFLSQAGRLTLQLASRSVDMRRAGHVSAGHQQPHGDVSRLSSRKSSTGKASRSSTACRWRSARTCGSLRERCTPSSRRTTRSDGN